MVCMFLNELSESGCKYSDFTERQKKFLKNIFWFEVKKKMYILDVLNYVYSRNIHTGQVQ